MNISYARKGKVMDERTPLSRLQVIPLQLDEDTTIKVEATALGGSEDVLDLEKVVPFQQVVNTIEKIARAMDPVLDAVKPDRGSVEFGIEVGIESGGVTALLVKGTSTGNLRITLEWGK
jgi:hypothetical protein